MALINCALYNIGDLCCVKLKCYFVVKVNCETMLFDREEIPTCSKDVVDYCVKFK